MLEGLLNYPVDTTGYMTIPRGIALVGALVQMSFVPARIDNRLFVIGGLALVVYANWLMLGYSPAWIGGRWSLQACSRAPASAR
jgi:MFS transporter, DHA2 family, multidrug resistance protein